ncbi:ParD-like family protein [bacterium]|nr:ParD-like family protein [bacterium]
MNSIAICGKLPQNVTMSKSIRISSELAQSAETAAAVSHRSPPQQIEHWAQIGRVLEPALSYTAEVKVKQVGRADLDAILKDVESADSVQRTQAIIRQQSGSIESTD